MYCVNKALIEWTYIDVRQCNVEEDEFQTWLLSSVEDPRVWDQLFHSWEAEQFVMQLSKKIFRPNGDDVITGQFFISKLINMITYVEVLRAL
jgi:hypothetical protein